MPHLFTWFRDRVTDPALVEELDALRKAYRRLSGAAACASFGEDANCRHGNSSTRTSTAQYFHADADKLALIEELVRVISFRSRRHRSSRGNAHTALQWRPINGDRQGPLKESMLSLSGATTCSCSRPRLASLTTRLSRRV